MSAGPNASCINGAVRLRGGANNSQYEGRVEVCLNDVWGTVCADIRWSDDAAKVVCRQLNLSSSSKNILLLVCVL